MEYKVMLKTKVQYEDVDYVKIETDSTDVAYISQLAKEQYKNNYDITDEIINMEVLEITNIDAAYYSITLTLSDGYYFSFVLKIVNEENVEEKINKRINRQVEKYNQMNNTSATIVSKDIKKIIGKECELYCQCVE